MKKLTLALLFTLTTLCYAQIDGQGDADGGAFFSLAPGSPSPQTPPTPTPVLASIVLAPQNTTVGVGSAGSYTATGTYSDGSQQNLTTTVAWSINQPTILTLGTLTTTQQITCLGSGSGQIRAVLNGVQGTTTQTCTPPAPPSLVSVVVTPSIPSITNLTSIGFKATGTYSDGTQQDITGTVVWSSSTPAVATVGPLTSTESGNCLTTGSTSITATLGSVFGSTTLTCVPPVITLVSISLKPTTPSINVNTSIGFIATGTFSDGSNQDVTLQATWLSSNTAVATLGGLTNPKSAICVTGGTSTISATVGAVSGSTVLTCVALPPPPPSLQTITLAPVTPSVTVNSSIGFIATGHYSDGSSKDLTLPPTLWTSQSTSVAVIVSPNTDPQSVRCVTVGSSLISASLTGITGSTTLTCVAPPPPTLVSILITPTTATQFVGSSSLFSAAGTYSDGSTKDVTALSTWSSSNNNIAAMTLPVVSPEPARCLLAGGPITITAAVGLVNDTSTLICQNVPVSGIVSNTFCGTTPGGIMPNGTHKPNIWICTSKADTPRTGGIVTVPTNGSLQNAYNAASCGTWIQPAAGGVYPLTGLTGKSCPDNNWIWIGPADSTNLPVEGQTTNPCFSGVVALPGYDNYSCMNATPFTAKITFSLSTPGGIPNSADHIRWMNVEFARGAGTAILSTMFKMDNSTKQVFDRVWPHGEQFLETQRWLRLDNSSYISVVDSYTSDFICTVTCTDAQVANAQFGTGPYKFSHNLLSASTEHVLFGGGGGAGPTPADIEASFNTFFRPMTWNPSCITSTSCPGGYIYDGGANGHPRQVKNVFELKNAQRVWLWGNRIINNWAGFSQVGNAITITPKSQAPNGCSGCIVTDVVEQNDYMSTVAQVWQIFNGSTPAGWAAGGHHYYINNVQADNVGNYPGCFGGCTNYFIELITGSSAPLVNNLHDVQLEHVGVVLFGQGGEAMMALGGPVATPSNQANLVIENSILPAGKFGIAGSGGGTSNCATPAIGIAKLTACWLPYTFTNNGIPWGNSTPAGLNLGIQNFFTADQNAVLYQNITGANYQLQAGSPFHNKGNDGKDLGVNQQTLNVEVSKAPYQTSVPIDMVVWANMQSSTRSTNHMFTSGNPTYTWMDNDNVKFWSEKAATGHPWDIEVYGTRGGNNVCLNDVQGNPQVCNWITENAPQFTNALGYKRQLTPFPVMTRYFTRGTFNVVDSPGPNTANRTFNCETDGLPPANLGPVHSTLEGPVVMPWNVGNLATVTRSYYYTQIAGGLWNDREQYFYAFPYGRVRWQHASWNGTAFVVDNTNLSDTQVAVGAPSPTFPCYGTTPNWIGGAPGAGGNSSAN